MKGIGVYGQSASNSGLPSYAPTGLAGTFNPALSLYTPANSLAKVHTDLAAALAGTGYFHAMFGGDSHTDPKLNDAAAGGATWQTPDAYCEQFKATLLADGYPDGGTGWVKFGGMLNPPDPRYTNVANVTGNRFGQGVWCYAPSTNAAVTLTLPLASNDGVWVDVLTTNNSKNWQLQVKDGAGTVIDTQTVNRDGTSSQRVSTFGPYANNVGSAVLTGLAGTGGNWRVGAMQIRKASGVLVSNFALTNSTVAGALGWSQDVSAGGAQYDWICGSCVATQGTPAISLFADTNGGNDWLSGTSAATIVAAKTTIYSRFPGASKLMIANWPGTNNQDALDAAYYTLADTLGIAFLDTRHRFGQYADMNPQGYYDAGSVVHPNAKPHTVMGRTLAAIAVAA